MNDVTIEKQTGGLGRRNPSGDMISGLLANGVAVVGGVQLNQIYRLAGTADANSLGLNEEYDTTNSFLVYEHINEFFRVNPDGDLRIMLLAQTVVFKDMVDKTMSNNAKKLLQEENGEIKQLAVAYNPSVAVTDFTATLEAIPKAQELVQEEFSQHRPIDIILEGKGFEPSNTDDLRDLNCSGVSVMAGQALSVSSREIASELPYKKYGAVGTMLGAVSRAKVNESIAWVEKFNLQGSYLQVPAIGNAPYNTISEGVLNGFDDKGVNFLKTHVGRAGVYFNENHVCTAKTDDYAYLSDNRTANKAARAIRQIILPRLNAPLLIDPVTGLLSSTVVTSFETDARRALEVMERNGEISGLDVYVDPNQNLLSGADLEIDYEVIPTGTARNIKNKLRFKNPLITN